MFDMSRRFHRGMVEQYKGRKVVQCCVVKSSFKRLIFLSQNSFSVFAAHSVWNSEEVRKVVPGAFAFTILR